MAFSNFFVGLKLLVLVYVCCESFQEIKRDGMKRHRAVKVGAINGTEYHVFYYTTYDCFKLILNIISLG